MVGHPLSFPVNELKITMSKFLITGGAGYIGSTTASRSFIFARPTGETATFICCGSR